MNSSNRELCCGFIFTLVLNATKIPGFAKPPKYQRTSLPIKNTCISIAFILKQLIKFTIVNYINTTTGSITPFNKKRFSGK